MFQNWGFLLTEIWVLLALAGLVGLLAGWIIWARGSTAATGVGAADGKALHDRDRQIDALRGHVGDRDGRIRQLEAELAETRGTGGKPAVSSAKSTDGSAESKPASLASPRRDGADDLKRIKGIGPALEKMCNGLGIYHYDQIAGWSMAELAWIDSHLEGFTGRASRDNWIEQAKLLDAGFDTEFSQRVDRGEVPTDD